MKHFMQTCLIQHRNNLSKHVKNVIKREIVGPNHISSEEKESVRQRLQIPHDYLSNKISNDQCLTPHDPIERTHNDSTNNKIAHQLTCDFCHSYNLLEESLMKVRSLEKEIADHQNEKDNLKQLKKMEEKNIN